MPAETYLQMRTAVYAQLDDNTDFYPELEVGRAVNEVIRVANLFVGFWQTTATIATQANRVFYNVPGSIVAPLAVDVDGRQLSRCSFAAMGARRKGWMRETTAQWGRVNSWIPLGIRKLAIHPVDSTGGRALRITGVAEPVPLTADGDLINAPDEVLQAIEHLAVHVLPLKEGGKVFADGASYYNEFLSIMKVWQQWATVKHPRFHIEVKETKEG